MKIRFIISLLAALLMAPSAWAMADFSAELLTIQQTWAKIKYQTPKADRQQAFKTLLGKTETLHDAYPDSSEVILWSAEKRFDQQHSGVHHGLLSLSQHGSCAELRAS